MTVKIIYNYDGNDAVTEKPKIDLEASVQKAFAVCNKVIDACAYVMDHVDIKQLYEKCTDLDVFEATMCDKKRLMRIFSLIVGKDVGVLQAMGYSTAMIRTLQLVAERCGIEISPDIEQKYKVEYMTDEEAVILGEEIRHLGLDYVHDFASQTRADAGVFDDEERCREYYQNKIENIKFKKLSMPALASKFGTFTPNNSVNVDKIAKECENKIGNPKDSRDGQKQPNIIVEHRPKVKNKEEQTVYSQYKKAYEQFKKQSEQDRLPQTIGHVEPTEEETKEFNNLTYQLAKEKQEAAKKQPKDLMRWNRRHEFGRHKFDSS